METDLQQILERIDNMGRTKTAPTHIPPARAPTPPAIGASPFQSSSQDTDSDDEGGWLRRCLERTSTPVPKSRKFQSSKTVHPVTEEIIAQAMALMDLAMEQDIVIKDLTKQLAKFT